VLEVAADGSPLDVTSDPRNPSVRIEVLTFLRFIAALIVVTFHEARTSPLIRPSPGLLTAGPEMVSFFFVLSGFVLVVSHWHRTDQPLRQFYWARIARIAPLYFLALAVTLPLVETIDRGVLAAHVLFLQAWLVKMPITLNVTGWSISVEAFFYAIFPFAFALIRHPRFPLKVLVPATLALWGVTQLVVIYLENVSMPVPARAGIHDLVFYFPVVHLGSFLMGMTGGAWFMTRGAERRSRAARSAMAAASLITAYLVIEFRQKWWDASGVFVPTSASVLAPLFLWVIISLALADGPVVRFFSRRPFVLLGEVSFAFYLLQNPLERFYGRYITHHMTVNDILGFVGCLLVLSFVSLFLFERPTRRWLLRRFERPRSPIVASPERLAGAAASSGVQD
jgi:peptidoglycan/LPS O-acetylase OafA/YrhL